MYAHFSSDGMKFQSFSGYTGLGKYTGSTINGNRDSQNDEHSLLFLQQLNL